MAVDEAVHERADAQPLELGVADGQADLAAADSIQHTKNAACGRTRERQCA